MDLSELRTRVQNQLGDTSEAQFNLATIDRWLNDAQVDVVRRTEVLQGSTVLTSTANTKDYALPTDLLSIRRVEYGGAKLQGTTLDELDKSAPNRAVSYPSDTPSSFYFWNRRLYLYPAPSTGGSNIEVFYIRLPLLLAIGTDIPEVPVSFHEDLVRYAVARGKELDEETEDATRIYQDYENRLAVSQAESTSPHSDSYSAVRTLAGDDW